MHKKKLSDILVVISVIVTVSVASVSPNALTVLAQPVTLEDILAAIEALNERLDNVEAAATNFGLTLNSITNTLDSIQSRLDSISATTATIVELAILNSSLDALGDTINNLRSDLASLNATTAQKSNVVVLSAAVDELSTTLDNLKADLSSLRNVTATSNELGTATSDLSEKIENVNTLVRQAIVTALIAALASTVAIYFILKKTLSSLRSASPSNSRKETRNIGLCVIDNIEYL